MKLLFTKGPLFYFFFNVRLFFVLLFTKSDLLFANDLDTLWANYLASRLRKIPLIYDSHEIFCEVPELKGTPLKKRIWESLEKRLVPKLHYCITVNQSIADYFKKRYGNDFEVVRNIPSPLKSNSAKSRRELGLPEDKKIAVYQGAGINVQRGAEELVESMRYTTNVYLLVIGGGDVFPKLKQMVSDLKLQNCVYIIPKIPREELALYTMNADLGISIDKDSNLNYHFSLPNKLFDYIQAGLPVMASPLPEIQNIITHYDVGDFISGHDPKHIAQKMEEMLSSPKYQSWKKNTRTAASENTWEAEKTKLTALIRSLK